MGGGQGTKLEAIATRLQKHKKKQDSQSWKRPGYQVGGQCYKVTKSTKAQEAQDSKVGGQSSGWRPKFRLENPLQSWEAYLQTCRVV